MCVHIAQLAVLYTVLNCTERYFADGAAAAAATAAVLHAMQCTHFVLG